MTTLSVKAGSFLKAAQITFVLSSGRAHKICISVFWAIFSHNIYLQWLQNVVQFQLSVHIQLKKKLQVLPRRVRRQMSWPSHRWYLLQQRSYKMICYGQGHQLAAGRPLKTQSAAVWPWSWSDVWLRRKDCRIVCFCNNFSNFFLVGRVVLQEGF